jgi:hypothetical protein
MPVLSQSAGDKVHGSATYRVPIERDQEDTDEDGDEKESQGEHQQLINDRSECVYVCHSSEAQLAQAVVRHFSYSGSGARRKSSLAE